MKLEVLFIVFITVSCMNSHTRNQQNIERYITDFEKFVEVTDENYKEFDKAIWKEANDKYKFYTETKYNEYERQLTQKQKVYINELIGRYNAIYAKAQRNGILDWIKNKKNQGRGFLEEFLEDD